MFGSSAAVLVVESSAAPRLLAPYLGLTLETSTIVIGIALAAIATVVGRGPGRRHHAAASCPRPVARHLLGGGGRDPVRRAGLPVRPAGSGAALLMAIVAILVPGALLSAVSPMVTKLALTDLAGAETGSVVGRLFGHRHGRRHRRDGAHRIVFLAALPVSSVLVATGVLAIRN